MRANGHFATSDPQLAEIRRRLFGDRFKAGFGLKDPAYLPLFPHEAANYIMSGGRRMWDKHHSAAELEKYIDQAPDYEQLGRNDGSERWYDDAARLAAKWIAGRLYAVPLERELTVTFWEVMESAFPHLRSMQLSTIQKEWTRSSVLRVIDAYRADGVL